MRARRRRWTRWLGAAIALWLLLVGGGALWVRSRVAASLPRLEGRIAVAGLTGPVRVERDAHGVPTLRGANRLDVARAAGFVHAQDRFFQMDLMRRRAAGELSALVGAAALPVDRAARRNRFRARAAAVLARLEPDEAHALEAYAEGVATGLASLAAPPPEYLALRQDPEPWKAEDSLLVYYAMFLDLHDESGEAESLLGQMHDTLPEALFAFLAPPTDGWDAPIAGEPFPLPTPPGPEVVDLRSQPGSAPDRVAALGRDEAVVPGSNNWAVAGSRTADRRALLANDMHLALRVPNIWYRASLVWADAAAPSGERRVTGVMLPGGPVIVAGSNGSVAWGFTNSQGDWVDLVELEVDPQDPERYRTPAGLARFEHRMETIGVAGGPVERFEVTETIWGPVVGRDHRGRLRALRWTAHDPEAVNLHMMRLETAGGLDEALRIAATVGAPPQNFVCVDAGGRIGWTIFGRIPRRFGHDGTLPASWADGSRGWDGWLDPEEYPRVVDPPEGLLWTANSRVVDGEMLSRIGDGNYAPGTRARQIRDDLRALKGPVTPADMLRIQLDDRALFLERWQALLLEALARPGDSPRRGDLAALVKAWGGRASVDSVGYRAVREFREAVAERALSPLLAACRAPGPECRYVRWFRHYEGPLWQLVSQRPPNLLDASYPSWDALLSAAADDALASLLEPGPDLAARTWGEANTARIRHPLSQAVPELARWLDMPGEPLPGDNDMPRVQRPASGASERFAVSPGNEAAGYFHMPGGQSGHPLSPFYATDHAAWAHGEATPFLPGETRWVLELEPAPAD